MISEKNIRQSIFVLLLILTFSVWFSDGYLQNVNSDVTREIAPNGYGKATIALPEAFWVNEFQRTRWVPYAIDFIAYNTVGVMYREITGDPVNAIYFCQGIVAGVVYLLLLSLSALYISFFAPILSWRYLVSMGLLLATSMSLPPYHPILFPVARFYHQTVMTHYLGTRIIALIALLPYWRYLCTGKWNDWYHDVRIRVPWIVFVVLSVFSSLMTTLSMVLIALIGILAFTWSDLKNKISISEFVRSFCDRLKDTKAHPLVLIVILGILSTLLEITSGQSNNGSVLSIAEYIPIFMAFISGKVPFVFYSIIGLTASILFCCLRKTENDQSIDFKEYALLLKLLPWLIIGSVVFIFVLGFPSIFYRYRGSNLSSDTILPATWLLLIWIMAGWVALWKHRKLLWLLPFATIVLCSHALLFFQNYKNYELRQEQKKLFYTMKELDKAIPEEKTLLIHNENGIIGFSPSEAIGTIPFMSYMGIISSNRKVELVSKDVYDQWINGFELRSSHNCRHSCWFKESR